jgi:competence protein ComEA
VDGGVTSSKVNINSASAEELETLPGIGEVIAQEILDYRTENGPFASVDDLLDVSGIGEVTLENVRDLVTV